MNHHTTDTWPEDLATLEAVFELQREHASGADGLDLAAHMNADPRTVEKSVTRLRAEGLVEVTITGPRRAGAPSCDVEHLVVTRDGLDQLRGRARR
jgi:predicted transcriptional regulator